MLTRGVYERGDEGSTATHGAVYIQSHIPRNKTKHALIPNQKFTLPSRLKSQQQQQAPQDQGSDQS